MILLISYDLNGHERPSAYDDVKEAVTKKAIDFKRPLFSQWLVETDDSASDWRDTLKAVMDTDDKLLIVRIRDEYSGWLPKSVWPWLAERV